MESLSSSMTTTPRKNNSLMTAILASLLVLAGMFGQYRYHVVEKLLAQNKSGQNSSQTSLGSLTGTNVPANKSNVDFSVFWEVWDILDKDYVDHDKIDATKMVDGAISGMTAALDDPYTAYLPPKAFERTGEELAGAFYGVGIELGYKEGILAVVAPLPDTPAASADVKPGDLIIKVKDAEKKLDADSSKWSLSEAVDAIRGPKGSKVTLSLVREGKNEPFDVDLTRGEIVVKSAELSYVEGSGKRVAHIKLSRFGERTTTEWNAIVGEILKEQPKLNGIVLDMRNNPGGLFDDAITIASEFIKDGVVVSEQGKFDKRDFSARGQARLTKLPLVLLVNQGSASASEIVAGALRDRLNVKLVGEKTFGKGTVQDRRDLSNGGGIHVTIAKWLLPGGSWIHKEGIPVTVEIKDNVDTKEDEQLDKAIEVL